MSETKIDITALLERTLRLLEERQQDRGVAQQWHDLARDAWCGPEDRADDNIASACATLLAGAMSPGAVLDGRPWAALAQIGKCVVREYTDTLILRARGEVKGNEWQDTVRMLADNDALRRQVADLTAKLDEQRGTARIAEMLAEPRTPVPADATDVAPIIAQVEAERGRLPDVGAALTSHGRLGAVLESLAYIAPEASADRGVRLRLAAKHMTEMGAALGLVHVG